MLLSHKADLLEQIRVKSVPDLSPPLNHEIVARLAFSNGLKFFHHHCAFN